MDFFDGLADMIDEEMLEPDWIQQNRQWFQDHPSVIYEKKPYAALDGCVSLEPARCDLLALDESMHIDSLFEERPAPRKRSFMEKIEVRELVDDQMDNFNIARMFADGDELSSCSESKRRPWTAAEESALLSFLNSFPEYTKISHEDWKEIAVQVGRNLCSVKNKAAKLKKFGISQKKLAWPVIKKTKLSIVDMISQCLDEMPRKAATAAEILVSLREKFGDVLGRSKWQNSVKQKLCTHFSKVPGIYSLLPDTPVIDKNQCDSMSNYIVWALQQFGPSTKSQIKAAIDRNFGSFLNNSLNTSSRLQTWEITFLKKLKVCPLVDFGLADTRYTFKT